MMSDSVDLPKRLLLYLDLLGFREMVKRGAANEIKEILSYTLNVARDEAGRRSKRLGSTLEVLYFSDTILLYPKAHGFSDETFRQLRYAAVVIVRKLLAKRIPVSGCMTYGGFSVDRIDGYDQVAYFGQSLVDAYDCEKSEKWLGVLVCPSIAKRLESSEIQNGVQARRWLTRGSPSNLCLLLNPFWVLQTEMEDGAVVPRYESLGDAAKEASRALAFICRTAEALCKSGDFGSSIAVRYHATVAFARTAFGEASFGAAVNIKPRARRAS